MLHYHSMITSVINTTLFYFRYIFDPMKLSENHEKNKEKG